MNINRIFYVITMCSLVAIAIFTGIDVGKNYVRDHELNKVWVLPEYQAISEVAEFEITAYDAYSKQSINVAKWRDGKTSTGKVATPGRTIAVDPRIIPHGSLVYIPSFGWRVAEDVGAAIKGYRIDILLGTTGSAMEFGRKKLPVLWVAPYAEDVVLDRVKRKAAQKAKKRTTQKPKKRTASRAKKGK